MNPAISPVGPSYLDGPCGAREKTDGRAELGAVICPALHAWHLAAGLMRPSPSSMAARSRSTARSARLPNSPSVCREGCVSVSILIVEDEVDVIRHGEEKR